VQKYEILALYINIFTYTAKEMHSIYTYQASIFAGKLKVAEMK
jgi:hypothetical protein